MKLLQRLCTLNGTSIMSATCRHVNGACRSTEHSKILVLSTDNGSSTAYCVCSHRSYLLWRTVKTVLSFSKVEIRRPRNPHDMINRGWVARGFLIKILEQFTEVFIIVFITCLYRTGSYTRSKSDLCYTLKSSAFQVFFFII